MVKLFYFVLWQSLIITIIGIRIACANFEKLKLKVTIESAPQTLMLMRVNRVLANEYLPVWMAIEFAQSNIMNRVGKFTFYHDDCSRSAFVYFHKRHQLYGVIGVTHYVKQFPIDGSREVYTIKPEYLHRVKNYHSVLSRSYRSIDNTTRIRTRREPKRKVYPELLVTISHDTYMDIEKDSKSSHDIATVSHVLTVYNAVDMLYKLIQSDDIQLNIAGIVIEGRRNQWGFATEGTDSDFYIDVGTVHEKISKYFWRNENHFPRHSYDIIVHHTRNILKDDEDDDNDEILGDSAMLTGGFMFPPNDEKDRFTTVVMDFATYEHFTTIAHELAHIFGAKHDGEGLHGYLYHMKPSDNTIMARKECCSKFCPEWSLQTQVEINTFFESSFYCNLRNYPRSLDVLRPKKIFSGRSQCNCYGYESHLGLANHLSKNGCSQPLWCIDKNDAAVKVPLPMDGTPCDLDKVCWNNMCTKYDNAK